VLAAACALAPAAHAAWGSIRDNNRAEVRPEPERRPQPAPHAEPAHVRVEPAPIRVEPGRVVERRREDIGAERGHAFFWWGFHPGMILSVLPVGWMHIPVGGIDYCYYDGVYYQPTPTGYAVIAPPVGAMVPALPDGAEPVTVGAITDYYVGGAFYQPQPNGFVVVPAPLGVIVSSLPPGAAPVTVNGAIYYVAGSTYYLPVMQGGATVYETAQP